MESTRSCYIIAAWGGQRRMPQHPDLEKDGALYLREHVKRVLSYCKSINHIVVASPRGFFYKGYEEYLAELEGLREVNGVTIEVFRRENVGFSYGSFSDVFGKHRTQFNYYFIAEDDYLPAVQDFDQILLRMIDRLPKCGFLCGLVWPVKDYAYGCAAIFLGLMRAEALEKIWLRNRCLVKLSNPTSYGEAERRGQVGLSEAIVNAGYTIEDWTKSYSSLFLRMSTVEVYGDPKLPPLYVPAQTI
jgi:hypothetical protein